MKRELLTALIGLSSLQAWGVPFESIRIGEEDGFGFGVAAGYLDTAGNAANRDDAGVLTQGDVLPDLDQGGTVSVTIETAPGSGMFVGFDDFDNRQGESVSCTGCADSGTQGAEYTDISLSGSYDALADVGLIFDANTLIYGTGGLFPDGNAALPNQPGFLFDFIVGEADIDPSQDIFFNLLFGDYDVFPAELRFERADGTMFIQNVFQQPPDQDGLIQAAFAVLDFSDIFTGGGGSDYTGFLKVDFIANDEPYTAFDFVELSTRQIQIDPIPVPATLALFGLGLAGLGWSRRKQQS